MEIEENDEYFSLEQNNGNKYLLKVNYSEKINSIVKSVDYYQSEISSSS